MKQAITNKTRKTVLHANPRWAFTALQQSLGLMFRRPGPDDCLIFLFLPARRVRFHMWFVFGPIDMVALDGKGNVIALKERFAPFAFWMPGINASAVLELPLGTIARTKTAVGDVMALPPRPA